MSKQISNKLMIKIMGRGFLFRLPNNFSQIWTVAYAGLFAGRGCDIITLNQ